MIARKMSRSFFKKIGDSLTRLDFLKEKRLPLARRSPGRGGNRHLPCGGIGPPPSKLFMAFSKQRTDLHRHVTALLKCRRCPRMKSTPVSGGPIVSEVILVGQAPGPREPVLQRPFAHTAGQTLFRWLEQSCGLTEAKVRSTVYFAAVCRCFPGKNSGGGDRVPALTRRGWLHHSR